MPSEEDPAGPEEGPERPPSPREDIMGYALFLLIAFVLLVAQRLVSRHHAHPHHRTPSRS